MGIKDVTKYEIVNAAYNGALFTVGAAVISFASKKIVKKDLSVPMSPIGVVKLAATVGGGSVLVTVLRENDTFKKALPEEMFKSSE